MADPYYNAIGPDRINEIREMYYDENGEIPITETVDSQGWDVVAQEIRIMMISGEDTIGSDPELAIDIRQYADKAADVDSAEIIQDWIEGKIQANPLLDPLDLIVELVPIAAEQFEIVFKRPYVEGDLSSDTYVDLAFKVSVDARSGTITGLLDDISEGGNLYSANPILVSEERTITSATNILYVNYTPVDTEPVLLYNKADISISNGEINVATEEVEVSIDLLPRRTYSLIDYSPVNLERAVIESYTLVDGSNTEIEESEYTIVGTNLVIPTNSSLTGSYTLKLIVSKRYANVKARTEVQTADTGTFIYSFLRNAEYKLAFDRSLKEGTYILQYYVYGDRT